MKNHIHKVLCHRRLLSLGTTALLLGAVLGLNTPTARAAEVTVSDATSEAIIDGQSCDTPLTRPFTITDNISVTRIRLGINITHTYRGDVGVFLRYRATPTATPTDVLVANVSFDDNDNYDILIDSNSTTALNDGDSDATSAPFFDRTVGPSNSLAPLMGGSAQGEWTVLICDPFAGFGTGTYNRLELTLSDDGPPVIDLDASGTGTGFQNTFVFGGGPVAAADTDVTVTDNGNIESATITLTNRPDGNAESLNVDVTAGGTVSGVTQNYDSGTGVLTLSTPSGTVSPADMAKVIATLTYNNSSSLANLDLSTRIINVEVTDDVSASSNTATTTLNISTPNPNFSASCSASGAVEVLFILDESGSVDATEREAQRTAVLDTLDYFINNNITATAGIVEFSNVSGTVINYTSVTSATRSDFETALNTVYTGTSGQTSWELAFQAAQSLVQANGNNNPDAIFFFTDGTENFTPDNGPNDEAGAFRNAGVHIYGIGIQDLGDTPNSDILEFTGITDGPNTTLFNGSNPNEADYVPISNYANLQSEFGSFLTSACTAIPNVLLVKRITAINGTPLTSVVNDGTLTDNDNHPRWPAGYLVGEVDAGVVQPGDDVEYTVYFLNIGSASAGGVRFCDRIQPEEALKLEAYGGPGQDVQVRLGTSTTLDLSAANDAADRTQFIAGGGSIPATCNLQGANTNGTLIFDITGAASTGLPNLTALPGSTGQGQPNDAYGFFRYTTTINQ